MKVRSYPNSPASSGSPFLSPISPAFPQGNGLPIPSRDAHRTGSSGIGVNGFYNQFGSIPGPSSAPATFDLEQQVNICSGMGPNLYLWSNL